MTALHEPNAEAVNRYQLGWLDPAAANRLYKINRCADCVHLRKPEEGRRTGRYCTRLGLPTGANCWCRAFAWRRRK